MTVVSKSVSVTVAAGGMSRVCSIADDSDFTLPAPQTRTGSDRLALWLWSIAALAVPGPTAHRASSRSPFTVTETFGDSVAMSQPRRRAETLKCQCHAMD